LCGEDGGCVRARRAAPVSDRPSQRRPPPAVQTVYMGGADDDSLPDAPTLEQLLTVSCRASRSVVLIVFGIPGCMSDARLVREGATSSSLRARGLGASCG
jgi:hypothetical protein